MLNPLILLLFLCPSVWSAAEVVDTIPVFHRNLVAVPGTGIEIEQGFMDFFEASKDDIHAYQQATEAGQEDNLPEVKAVRWFLNKDYREAFVECGKVRTAFLEKKVKGPPFFEDGTPEKKKWEDEYSIFNFINSLTDTFLGKPYVSLKQPIDFENPETITLLLGRLTDKCANALSVMEGTIDRLFT